MDGLVGGAVAQQPAHADVVRVVVLDPLLAPQAWPTGAFSFGERHHLVVRAAQPLPQKSATFFASSIGRGEVGVRWPHRDDVSVAGAVTSGGSDGAPGAAMSPGSATTETPRLADRVLDGGLHQPRHCVGVEISSQ